MKFDIHSVYEKMYGSFRCDSDKEKFLAEQDMMYYYIANNYENVSQLSGLFASNNITNEYLAKSLLIDYMAVWEKDIIFDKFDKSFVARGRRMFTAACSTFKFQKEMTVEEKAMDAYPSIPTFYVLYDSDQSVKWIYVDEEVECTPDLPVSKFPAGFKEALSDKLTTMNREGEDYV